MAHITGGGLIENIPRVLPANLQANINLDTIDLPPVFKWLKKNGNIDDPELIKTFNCGIGMVLIINPNELSSVTEILNDNDEEPVILGKIVISNDDKSPIKFTACFKMPKKYSIVVPISGRGSNLQAIVEACLSGIINGAVCAVISSNQNALGLERSKVQHSKFFYCQKYK